MCFDPAKLLKYRQQQQQQQAGTGGQK